MAARWRRSVGTHTTAAAAAWATGRRFLPTTQARRQPTGCVVRVRIVFGLLTTAGGWAASGYQTPSSCFIANRYVIIIIFF